MKKHLVTALFAVVSVFLLQGCSPAGSLIAHQRDADFYNQFVNSSADWPQAESKIDELKVMQTGSEYPMRYVFFDNGKFYYQVDRLGTGEGVWSIQKGALIATAQRTIFEMELAISAADDKGNDTLVRFYDRHGLNSIQIKLRDPQAIKAQGKMPTELRKFTRSEKNI
ncbi:transposase [Bdellovibrio sp. HCB185ZH]|uniref:transposase n=1 Tax=Bdellovibrio sp. HCB185ZH TaxID=3394235 RepID=UPI0039A42322